MRWHEISAHTDSGAVEMIAHIFHEQGANGVEIVEPDLADQAARLGFGEWFDGLPPSKVPPGRAIVKGYFPAHEPVENRLAALQAAVAEWVRFGLEIAPLSWETKTVREEDWAHAWKQYYKPVRVTERLTVKPVWEEYEPHAEETVIELDPGMAFGTGTHPTTCLCLKAIERHLRPGQRAVDVGTGSGILAIAAAKLGASEVWALDLDPAAVQSARSNVSLNGLEHVVRVLCSDLLTAVSIRQADLVVANILAPVILRFVGDVFAVLNPGGLYIVSGIVSGQEREVAAALQAAGFMMESRLQEEDWIALVAAKPLSSGGKSV